MNPSAFTGGARVGESYWLAMNYSWPLASLTVQQDEIYLNMPFKRISFARSQITGIRAYRGIISDGIQIQHTSEAAPRFVVFWTSSSQTSDALKLFNYPHETPNEDKLIAPSKKRVGVIVPLLIFVFVFLLEFVHETQIGRGLPDVILNATVLAIFPATIYFFIRKRMLR